MRAHQIDTSGVIINTIMVDDLGAFPNLIDASVGGAIGDTWDGHKIIPGIPAKTREELKAERQQKVDNIIVTVNGKAFNGDETSQTRMDRALRAADFLGQTSCVWVLADNTPTTVTKDELNQALAMSIQAMASVWVIPK